MKVFERLIYPFQPAEGAPPQGLWAYGRWAARGAEGPILALLGVSILLGITEAAAAFVVAWAVDLSVNSPKDTFFSDNL